MAGWLIGLAMSNEEVARLTAVSRSRTEPTSRDRALARNICA